MSEQIEQATAAPGEKRPLRATVSQWRPTEVCEQCGAVVADMARHVDWHADA